MKRTGDSLQQGPSKVPASGDTRPRSWDLAFNRSSGQCREFGFVSVQELLALEHNQAPYLADAHPLPAVLPFSPPGGHTRPIHALCHLGIEEHRLPQLTAPLVSLPPSFSHQQQHPQKPLIQLPHPQPPPQPPQQGPIKVGHNCDV
jgi:hypothetical protein